MTWAQRETLNLSKSFLRTGDIIVLPVFIDAKTFDIVNGSVMLVEQVGFSGHELYGGPQEFWTCVYDDGTVRPLTITHDQFGKIFPLNRELLVEL